MSFIVILLVCVNVLTAMTLARANYRWSDHADNLADELRSYRRQGEQKQS